MVCVLKPNTNVIRAWTGAQDSTLYSNYTIYMYMYMYIATIVHVHCTCYIPSVCMNRCCVYFESLSLCTSSLHLYRGYVFKQVSSNI